MAIALATVVWILSVSSATLVTDAFVSRGWISTPTTAEYGSRKVLPLERNRRRTRPTSLFASDIVDVEFENVDESPSPPRKKKQRKKRPVVKSTSTSGRPTKTLIEMSLDMDPEMKNLPIPFEDGRNYIDCNIAFMAELDGVNYAIGVPHEYSAAVAIQDKNGKAVYLNPDDDENIELMQIMASELKKEFGEDLSLKRTPRVLTIAGDLGRKTDEFFDKIQTVETEKLLDESGETEEWFHEFMRNELGEEEYRKTMEEDDDEEDIDEELLKLFDIPGLGTSADDVEGMNQLLEEMFDQDPSAPFDAINKNLEKDNVSLRLVGFNFKDGNSYSLVQMLKPWTLLARQVIGKKDEVRFELLTAEEQKVVVPKLEKLCEDDLRQAGLSLQAP